MEVGEVSFSGDVEGDCCGVCVFDGEFWAFCGDAELADCAVEVCWCAGGEGADVEAGGGDGEGDGGVCDAGADEGFYGALPDDEAEGGRAEGGGSGGDAAEGGVVVGGAVGGSVDGGLAGVWLWCPLESPCEAVVFFRGG